MKKYASKWFGWLGFANIGQTQTKPLFKIALVAGLLGFCALALFVRPSFFLVGEVSGADSSQSGTASQIVVEEYLSLTCPHCAVFHREIYPQLAEGVLSHRGVTFLYRDFPLDGVALQAAVLSRCGGEDLRAKLMGAMLERQDKWLTSSTPIPLLISIVQLVGIDEARAKACLLDKSLERAVLEEQIDGSKNYKISSTPSIVVAGKKIEGSLSAKKIVSAINKELARAGLPEWK